ncbi:hypothetical protein [Geobacter sp. AOG2]|uniref:hypothetical protein n=1 Tax=Geobacter sp. AOG2 TaxID=1566347 RepID=UPI001CC79D7A|nr:hypothetical protein [Geobacter sp. AOG2]GFE60784.1 hypothetical protein AOG2_13720 [Geobacter sp. AOG2]
MHEFNRNALLAGLESSLEEQGRLHGCTRNDVQRGNLKYAFQEVVPATHTEGAFVVWAGTRCQPAHDVVDEYCRRKAGQESRLFDHEVLSLKGWCQPDTQRILVFREQIESLVKELSGNGDGKTIANGIYRFCETGAGTSLDEFMGMVISKGELSAGVISDLYDYIKERYASSLPYAWCSTIVERALHSAGQYRPDEP